MSTIETKIAGIETEIYRTVQNLDWIQEVLQGAEVDLDELRVSLDGVAISPKTVESLAAWAKVPGVASSCHSAGNPGIYSRDLDSGTALFVFVRADVFMEWDRRRGATDSVLGKLWPTRALGDDLQAFHASTGDREVTA